MIITDIQLGWLKDILGGKITKHDDPRKYSAYMKRIQNRIDHMLDNLIVLAEIAPDILKYEEREFDDPSIERHIRLKKLLRVCVDINPYKQDPTLFKILAQLTSFNIELIKKPNIIPRPIETTTSICSICSIEFEKMEGSIDICYDCSKDL